jgi:hypothetical protein
MLCLECKVGLSLSNIGDELPGTLLGCSYMCPQLVVTREAVVPVCKSSKQHISGYMSIH